MEENPDSTPQPTAPAMAPEAGARRGRVLVAEDNALIQVVTVATLAILGYDADVVADGRQAVEAAARNDYVAVFMDCQMPEMDGYQATAEIRRLEAGRRHTPIIALTASPGQDNRQACLAAGMDDHLSKPARKEDFAAALQRNTSSRRGTSTTLSSQPGWVHPPAGWARFPWNVARKSSAANST